MASSTHSQIATSLGKKLVEELGVDETNDTLSRWMSHYIAEKIKEITRTKGTRRELAERECFQAILELWDHRSAFPLRSRPFGDFEPLFRTLSTLDGDDATPRYFREIRSAASTDDVSPKSEQWLETATRLDDAAGLLIRYCLAAAAEAAADRAQEWVKLAEALNAPLASDVRIVHFILDDVETLIHDARAERLRQLTERLDAFTRVAKTLSAHFRRRQRKETTSPAKAKNRKRVKK